MANELNIRLVLDGNQLRAELHNSSGAVESFSTKTKESANQVGSAFDGMAGKARGALGAVAAMAGISLGIGIVQQTAALADTWSDLTSRVQVASGAQVEASDVMDRLSVIARQTYSSLELTAETYTRNATTLNALGKSTQQQLDYAQALNNALVVSSAKGEQAAMVQNSLAKAMAEGSLRGEEFNNVVNYGSRVAELLASELGVNVTQLRALAKDGKITGDVLFNALVRNMQQLTEEAEKMPATIGDGFTLVRNAVLQTVGVFDQSAKLSESFASALIPVADNMGSVLTVMSGIAASAGVAYIAHLTASIVAKRAAAAQTALLAGAELKEAQAAEVAALAALNQTRQRTFLVGTTVEATAVENAYAAAQARTAAAQAAATAAGAAKIGMLARMGSSLLALAGGPIGVAVLALGGLAIGIKVLIDVENEREAAWREGLEKSAADVESLRSRVAALNEEYAKTGQFRTGSLGSVLDVQSEAEAKLAGKRAELATKTEALRKTEEAYALAKERALYAAEGSSLAAAAAASRLAGDLAHQRAEADAAQKAVDALGGGTAALTSNLEAGVPSVAAYAEMVSRLKAAANGDWSALYNLPNVLDAMAGGFAVMADTKLGPILAEQEKQFDDAAKKIDEYTKGTKAYRLEQQALAIALETTKGAAGDVSALKARFAEINKAIAQSENLGKAEKDAAAAARELLRERERQAKVAQDYVDGLKDELATLGLTGAALVEYEIKAKKLSETQAEEARTTYTLITARERAIAAVEKHTRAVEDANRAELDLVRYVTETAVQLGGPSAQAAMAYSDELARIVQWELQLLALGPLTLENEQTIAAARSNAAVLYQRDLDEMEGSAKRVAEETARAWKQEISSFSQAAADGTDSVADYFSNLWKRIKASFIESGITSLLSQVFGAMQGGGSSGGGFNFTSMLSSAFGNGGGSANSQWMQYGKQLWNGFFGASGAAGTAAGYGVLASTGTQLASSGAYFGYTGAGSAYAGSYGVLQGSGYGMAGGAGATGSASGASGGAGMAGAASAAAWFAAAIAANFMAYGNGWRKDGGSLMLPNGQSVYGGGQGQAFGTAASTLGAGGILISNLAESLLSKIGLNDKWANILSGASLVAKVFGRKAPVLTGSDIELGVGAGGARGSEAYGIYEKGGWLSSSKRYTKDFQASAETLSAAQDLFALLSEVMHQGAAQMQTGAGEMINASLRIKTEFEQDGKTVKATKYIVEAIGRTWEEATQEAAVSRLSSEALIAQIDASLGTAAQAATEVVAEDFADALLPGLSRGAQRLADRFGDDFGDAFGQIGIGNTPSAAQGEASQIAERWRADAELLAQGAQFLIAAATDIRHSVGLLGDDGGLTAITDLIEDMAHSGETLLDTYARVAASSALLDQALALSGVQIEGTRETLVRFAADVADAAGGLDRAAALWSDYFDRYYSDTERTLYALTQLQAQAAGEFGDIGLNMGDFTGDGGAAALRALFEERLPTLGAEAVVQWLEALAALGAVSDAQAAYNATLADGVAAQEEAACAAADEAARLVLASQEYGDFIEGIRRETETLSEYQSAMRAANEWYADAVSRANELARAAGLAGAREQDLATIELRHAQLAAEAIRQLRQSTQDLIAQLYGPLEGSLDAINAQIQALESQTASSLDSINSATDDAYANWRRNITSVQDYLDSMLLGDLSALSYEDKLAEALRQFQSAVDAGDGQNATQLADAYLRLLRQGEASGDDWNDGFRMIREALQGMLNMSAPSQPGAAGGPVTITYSAELQALYEQRDALLAEQEAANRLAMAQQLAGYLVELAAAQEQPILDLAQSLGVRLDAFVTDLGVDLSNVTVATVQQLADISGVLGVSLQDLSASVGLSIGALTDQYSLAAGALAAEILGLPAGTGDALAPYLDAIYAATTQADASAATQTMADYIATLDADIRNQLAPYFDGMIGQGQTAAQQALSLAQEQYGVMMGQLEAVTWGNVLLDRIASNLASSNDAAGIPSYAVGTYDVPQTGPAILHAGEMVLPVPMAQAMRDGAFGGGDNTAILAELRRIGEKVDKLERTTSGGTQQVSAAVTKAAADSDRSNDQSRARIAQSAPRSFA